MVRVQRETIEVFPLGLALEGQLELCHDPVLNLIHNQIQVVHHTASVGGQAETPTSPEGVPSEGRCLGGIGAGLLEVCDPLLLRCHLLLIISHPLLRLPRILFHL